MYGGVEVGVNGYCFWLGGGYEVNKHVVKPDVIINMVLQKKMRSSSPLPII